MPLLLQLLQLDLVDLALYSLLKNHLMEYALNVTMDMNQSKVFVSLNYAHLMTTCSIVLIVKMVFSAKKANVLLHVLKATN